MPLTGSLHGRFVTFSVENKSIARLRKVVSSSRFGLSVSKTLPTAIAPAKGVPSTDGTVPLT